MQTKAGKPFQVFTPFWKACLARPEPAEPLPPLPWMPAPDPWPETLPLAQLELEPVIDWAAGIRAAWRPGCQHATAQLDRFLDQALCGYAQDRDRPDMTGSSRLSPYLHFGEISPRQVWHTVQDAGLLPGQAGTAQGAEAYLRELGWREFAHHVLYHFPHTTTQPLRPAFAAAWPVNAPWRHLPPSETTLQPIEDGQQFTWKSAVYQQERSGDSVQVDRASPIANCSIATHPKYRQ